MNGHGVAAVVVTLTACGVSLLFLTAFLGKLDAWHSWRQLWVVLIPRRPRLQSVAAVMVPIIELAVAGLTAAHPAFGLLSASVVFGSFAVFAAVGSSRYGGVSCNCFGALLPSHIGAGLALRNLALVAVAGTGAYFAAARSSDAPLGASAFALAGVVVLVGVLAAELLRFRRLANLQDERGSA